MTVDSRKIFGIVGKQNMSIMHVSSTMLAIMIAVAMYVCSPLGSILEVAATRPIAPAHALITQANGKHWVLSRQARYVTARPILRLAGSLSFQIDLWGSMNMERSMTQLMDDVARPRALLLMHEPSSQKCQIFSIGEQPRLRTMMAVAYNSELRQMMAAEHQKNILCIPRGENMRTQSTRMALLPKSIANE